MICSDRRLLAMSPHPAQRVAPVHQTPISATSTTMMRALLPFHLTHTSTTPSTSVYIFPSSKRLTKELQALMVSGRLICLHLWTSLLTMPNIKERRTTARMCVLFCFVFSCFFFNPPAISPTQKNNNQPIRWPKTKQ